MGQLSAEFEERVAEASAAFLRLLPIDRDAGTTMLLRLEALLEDCQKKFNESLRDSPSEDKSTDGSKEAEQVGVETSRKNVSQHDQLSDPNTSHYQSHRESINNLCKDISAFDRLKAAQVRRLAILWVALSRQSFTAPELDSMLKSNFNLIIKRNVLTTMLNEFKESGSGPNSNLVKASTMRGTFREGDRTKIVYAELYQRLVLDQMPR